METTTLSQQQLSSIIKRAVTEAAKSAAEAILDKLLDEGFIQRETPVNEDIAAEFVGRNRNTLAQYARTGKLDGTYTIDRLGNRMYYKSRLAPFIPHK